MRLYNLLDFIIIINRNIFKLENYQDVGIIQLF